jgi:hypothetical protein
MSCSHHRRINYLDVYSEIHRNGCAFTPGTTAVHKVVFRNWAVKDIDVGFTSHCPNGTVQYPGGYDWTAPKTMVAAADLRSQPEATFVSKLSVPASVQQHSLPQIEQIQLNLWRRKRPAGRIEPFEPLPIEVSIL